jgi:hypothetical protein
MEQLQRAEKICGHAGWQAWTLVFVIALYLSSTVVPLEMLPQNRYYNLLADSFLAGSLSLLEKPSPELLALADPYDPQQNGPYRLHDVALYKGRYYLYHGATPALLVFAPAKALLGVDVSQSHAVWLFLCGGLIAATCALGVLIQYSQPASPRWLMLAGIATLGLGNAGPFLLVRPDVYEVAISCGYFLAMAFMALALSSVLMPDAHAGRRLAIASLCAGMAVGARPNFIVLGPILLAAAWWHAGAQGDSPLGARFLRRIIGILAPFTFCILAILLYNYLRFENALEFGPHHLLMATHPHIPFFRIDTYPERLWRFLFTPGIVDQHFPWVHLPSGTSFGEPEIGGIFMAPLILLAGVGMALLCLKPVRASLRLDPLRLVVIFAAGVLMLLLLPVMAIPVIRYMVDFVGLLLLASFFVWSQVRVRLAPQPGLRRAFDALCLLLVAWGCWVGVVFGTNATPPSAIRHFYSARKLVDQGRQAEALKELSTSLTVAPDFYRARSLRARLLAFTAGADAAEAAAEFSRAMRDYTSQAAAAQNRGYMPAFQGLVIGDPVAEYALVAQPLLQRGETAAALSALRGMADAFVAAGFGPQALGILEAVKSVAARSNLPDFARMVGEMIGPAANQSAPPPGP